MPQAQNTDINIQQRDLNVFNPTANSRERGKPALKLCQQMKKSQESALRWFTSSQLPLIRQCR